MSLNNLLNVSAHQITGELNRANLSNTGNIRRHRWAAVQFLKLCADILQSFQKLGALGNKEKPARAVELHNRCLKVTHNNKKILLFYSITLAKSA